MHKMIFSFALVVAFTGLVAVTPAVATSYYQHKHVIIAVPVNPDYYYTVGDDDAEDRLVEKIAQRIARTISRRPQQGNSPSAAPEEDDFEASFRLVGAAKAKKGDSIDSQVLGLFNTTCVKCHKPGASTPGNIILLTSDRRLFVDPDAKKEARRRQKVYDSVESGDMPKNAPTLPPSVKNMLAQWAKTK
jgi:hypothetical protein